jgi:hypothetical protein
MKITEHKQNQFTAYETKTNLIKSALNLCDNPELSFSSP